MMKIQSRMAYGKNSDGALSLYIEASNGADRLFLSELIRRGHIASLDEYGDLTLRFLTEEEAARQEVEALLG